MIIPPNPGMIYYPLPQEHNFRRFMMSAPPWMRPDEVKSIGIPNTFSLIYTFKCMDYTPYDRGERMRTNIRNFRKQSGAMVLRWITDGTQCALQISLDSSATLTEESPSEQLLLPEARTVMVEQPTIDQLIKQAESESEFNPEEDEPAMLGVCQMPTY